MKLNAQIVRKCQKSRKGEREAGESHTRKLQRVCTHVFYESFLPKGWGMWNIACIETRIFVLEGHIGSHCSIMANKGHWGEAQNQNTTQNAQLPWPATIEYSLLGQHTPGWSGKSACWFAHLHTHMHMQKRNKGVTDEQHKWYSFDNTSF